MKRNFKVVFTLLCAALLSVFCLLGCKKDGTVKATVFPSVDATKVVILIDESKDGTLIDAMNYLQKEGALTYTLSGTMVESINGIANTTNSFWMLYTSDSEMANTAWGTVEYNGATFGSAILGADQLEAVVGAYYVWVYTTF